MDNLSQSPPSPRQNRGIAPDRVWAHYALLPGALLLLIVVGWYLVITQATATNETIIRVWQQAELEIVRGAARSVETYVRDQTQEYNPKGMVEIEQEIFKRYIAPIRLLENGDAWIYAPDHVVYDHSADFPDEYRGKSMAEIFALQARLGASHYQEMTVAVMTASEGVGWYIWLPEKGQEIAAWTPVQIGDYTWTIGLSTPLPEVLMAFGATRQIRILQMIMTGATLIALILLCIWGYTTVQHRRIDRAWRESAASYRALAENSPDVIMRFDRQGRRLYANQAALRMADRSPADFAGKTHHELGFGPEQADYWNQSTQQVFASGKLLQEQFDINGLNGQLTFDWRLIPEFTVDGKVQTVLALARDITELKRAEMVLQERIIALTQPLGDVSELKFEDLFNLDEIQKIQDAFAQATGVASIITDIEGRPITRSSNFCRLCTEIIRTTPAGLANCMKSDAVIGHSNPAGPTIQPCLSVGLMGAGASLMVGERRIGNWLIGQVLDSESDEIRMVAYARAIGANEADFRAALAEVPRMPRDQFDKVSQALFLIARQLSKLAIQNVQQARDLARRQQAEAAAAQHQEALRRERDLVAQVMETSPVGIVLIEGEGQITFANRQAERVLGLTRNKIMQRSYNSPEWHITDTAGRPMPDSELPFNRARRAGRSVFGIEHAIEWPNGRRVLLSANVAPLFSETGKLDSVITTIEDITTQFQAEEALRQSEERYRLLFNEMLNGFGLHEVICNSAGHPVDYRFLEVNPAFERLTGLQAKNLIGRTVLQVMPGTEPYWIKRYGRVALTGEPAYFEDYSRELGKYYQIIAFSPQQGQFAVIFADVTELKQAETALRDSEERLRTIFEGSPVGIATIALGPQASLLQVNEAFCRMLNYTKAEMARLTLLDISHPDDIQVDVEMGQKLVNDEIPGYQMEKRLVTKDKRTVWTNLTTSLIRDRTGRPLYGLWIIENITERKQAGAEKERLQMQLLQAQKMEAVGQLAGGIAHDFNNILTAIMGHAGMAQALLAPDHPAHQDLQGINASAQRAAGLTRQLLTFARRQVTQPQVLNMNDLILNIHPMLRRLIGEHIELVMLPGSDLDPVQIDPHQLEQILVNLVVNARDAMPNGGTITIKTANASLSLVDTQQYIGVSPGRYVVLTVSDTGVGMSAEVKEHIFEPFYTTKPVGQGTGLGLATCFGIVNQHAGHIRVESELEQGATFMVYLPQSSRPATPELSPYLSSDLPVGTETILLVEDESLVRELAARTLQGQGYTVIQAGNGTEALQLLQSQPELSFQLLVTDVVMPLLGGPGLAEHLRGTWPELKVLFMSGYTDVASVQRQLAEPGFAYLPKPFTVEKLARQVRQLLDL